MDLNSLDEVCKTFIQCEVSNVSNIDVPFISHGIDLIVPDHTNLSKFGFSCEYYVVESLPIFHLIKLEFIEAFIKRGKFYLMSEDTKNSLNDSVLIMPTNNLILHVSKDIYQELGLQGEPVTHGRSKNPQTFVIKINLAAENFIPGKRNYDRVLERFNSRRDLKFNCLVAWEPNDNSVCSSSIASYFESQLNLNVRLCNIMEKRKTKLSCAIPVIRPLELGGFEFIFDWIGFIANDFDNASSDSFVTEFLTDMPVCKDKKLQHIRWRGFITQDILKSILKTLRQVITGASNWLAVVIHGFDGVSCSEILTKECNSCVNCLCFIMFADDHHWKIIPFGRQKMF